MQELSAEGNTRNGKHIVFESNGIYSSNEQSSPTMSSYSGYIISGVPFAVDKTGRFCGIDEVDSGLACNCFCPGCGTPVVARHGDVRIHHFAHKDRRECWSALEAALWGMFMRICQEPNAKLLLPPAGNISEHFPNLREVVKPNEVHQFTYKEWIIPETVLKITSTDVRAPCFNDAQPNRADIVVNGVYVCLLHSRRKDVDLKLPHSFKHPVLCIDLSVYAHKWIGLCASRGKAMNKAINEIQLFRKWMEEDGNGRQWFNNPFINQVVEEIKQKALLTKDERAKAWDLYDKNERIAVETKLKKEAEVRRARLDAAQSINNQNVAYGSSRMSTDGTRVKARDLDYPDTKVEDEFIAIEPGLCSICRNPLWRVKAGTAHGPYLGRMVIRCSVFTHHPTRIGA